MAIDRLDLYNNALMLCGERALATLQEEREPRRLLDQVYDTNGVDFCLEQGQWWFAMRTVMIDPDPDISPSFGFRNAFTKPDDWIKTNALCSDEYFRVPLLGYADEVSNWYADITPIYVKYVSNDEAFGGDISRWPATFADYAAAYFASRIIPKLAGDKTTQKDMLFGPNGHNGEVAKTLHKAKAAAGLTQPTTFPAQGNWSRARQGRRGGGPMGDRGSPGSLTG